MNQDIKSQLFGAVKKPEKTGRFTPVRAEIEAPFQYKEKDDTVAKVFCRGCGNVMEITRKGAPILAEEAGVKIASVEKLTGKFFEVGECFVCDTGFGGYVELREISSLE